MKNNRGSESLKEWLINHHLTIMFIFASALITINELSLMNTLFPYCVLWMYYGFSVIVILGALIIIQYIYNRKQKKCAKKQKKKDDDNDALPYIITFWLIIITSLVALPNRFIPIGSTKVITGKVVGKTKWKLLLKTAGGWQNYVKIKIDGENTFFWYNLDYENKEYGTRCIINERKGIWGLRYVTNVDFIVE